jgi:hypothetical protein
MVVPSAPDATTSAIEQVLVVGQHHEHPDPSAAGRQESSDSGGRKQGAPGAADKRVAANIDRSQISSYRVPVFV